MKKKLYNTKILNEKFIINNFFKKLNFNKKETFYFENDSAFLNFKKNKKLIVNTDTIIENVDFFKGDNPSSIAHKIISINLSDLSAMGGLPYCYTLSLCLPKKIDYEWLKVFSNKLLYLQKKFNFFLLGGDLSKSKNIVVTSTFFGISKVNKIISQNKFNLNDDIWITGNLGESLAGFKFIKNKFYNFHDTKLINYFKKKYYYPKACILGSKISRYCNSAKDISDGFFVDLSKMLNNNYGASINLNNIPISTKVQKLIKLNILTKDEILSWGDDYELIIIIPKKYENTIQKISRLNNTKITKVGSIINKKGIHLDSKKIIKSFKYFDHFF